MKIICIECTAEELRANRGVMDAVVDAMQGFVNALYGTYKPTSSDMYEDEDTEDDEEKEED